MNNLDEMVTALRSQITKDHGIEALNDLGIVLYSDGGCRPRSRGWGGWGVHGYVYISQVPKKGHGLKDEVPTEYGYVSKSDGSPTAVTVLAYIDCFGSICRPDSTSNEAELTALLNASDIALRLGVKKAQFCSDSQYTINGAKEWLTVWKSLGWRKRDKSEIPNVNTWIQIDGQLNALKETGVDTTFTWVQGHSGLLGNDLADNLATRGVFASLKGVQCSYFGSIPAQAYWKSEVSYHPLMADSRWLFILTAPRVWNGYAVYHLSTGTAKRDVPEGKAHAEANHAVLLCKEANPIMEDFFNGIKQLPNIPTQRVCQATLTNLFKRPVINELALSNLTGLEFVSPSITPNHPVEHTAVLSGLRTVQEINVLEVLDPPKISLRSLTEFGSLESILTQVLEKGIEHLLHDENAYYRVTDITSVLFAMQTDAKGKEKLKITGDNGDAHITVPYYYEGKELDLHLHYGVDLPRRRGLASIADLNPKVYLFTWKETSLAFRYLTVIQTDDCIGIWAGSYSNLRLLPFKKS